MNDYFEQTYHDIQSWPAISSWHKKDYENISELIGIYHRIKSNFKDGKVLMNIYHLDYVLVGKS